MINRPNGNENGEPLKVELSFPRAEKQGYKDDPTQQSQSSPGSDKPGPKSNQGAQTGAKGDRAKDKEQQGCKVLPKEREKDKPEDE
ncbi:hypothetical protein BTVI_99296 [Pitangus sulphuratus]|nr:hypothetical protein BTVI_99296 [Pitangus sulphuratus]